MLIIDIGVSIWMYVVGKLAGNPVIFLLFVLTKTEDLDQLLGQVAGVISQIVPWLYAEFLTFQIHGLLRSL